MLDSHGVHVQPETWRRPGVGIEARWDSLCKYQIKWDYQPDGNKTKHKCSFNRSKTKRACNAAGFTGYLSCGCSAQPFSSPEPCVASPSTISLADAHSPALAHECSCHDSRVWASQHNCPPLTVCCRRRPLTSKVVVHSETDGWMLFLHFNSR